MGRKIMEKADGIDERSLIYYCQYSEDVIALLETVKIFIFFISFNNIIVLYIRFFFVKYRIYFNYKNK